MRGNSKLAKFFMLGVIPFIFTVVLIVAILIFFGVDVGAGVANVGQSLPFVGKYFAGEVEKSRQYEQKITQMSAELQEKDQLIRQLEQQLQVEQEKSDELEQQSLERISKEQAEAEEQWIDSYKQAAKSLSGMSASKAAPIVSQMPPQEGLMVIYAMNTAEQSQLLSKLPPDQAALFTTMLKELLQLSNHMSRAQALVDVMDQYETEVEEVFDESEMDQGPAEWALMFASMPPANAATILEEMNEESALNILRELDVNTRASILSQLEAQTASQFSQQLVNDS